MAATVPLVASRFKVELDGLSVTKAETKGNASRPHTHALGETAPGNMILISR